MKKIFMPAATVAAALLMSACAGAGGAGGASVQQSLQSASSVQSMASGAANADSAYHKISAEEAYKMIQENGAAVTVVDVRTEAEYAEGHIENALLVPNETIADKQPEPLPDLDAVLLIYCRSGRRSKEASDKLADLGYKNIYDFGGINDWPYDVVTD